MVIIDISTVVNGSAVVYSPVVVYITISVCTSEIALSVTCGGSGFARNSSCRCIGLAQSLPCDTFYRRNSSA